MIRIHQMVHIPEEAFPHIDKSGVGALVADIAESARNHWILLASRDEKRGMKSFRRDYIHGIQPVQLKPGHFAVVSLVGEVAHMIENGTEQQDMRDFLLGPNVPVVPVGDRGKHETTRNGKKGYYRAIPFRHSGPTSGNVAGQPMGSAYSGHALVEDAKKMGNAIYKAAKKLKPTKTDPYGATTKGGSLRTDRMRAGLQKGTTGIPKLKPHHKTDIYSGMIRSEKTYERATQSTFTTFRTISTLVPEGWIRAPIPARNYAEKVGEFVQKIAPKALEAFIAEQMK